MTDYRPGDTATPHGTLRLSVGALAQMADRLDAPDPACLAARLRGLTPDMARCLLACLLRPDPRLGTVEERAARLSDAQLAAVMPAIIRCITTALSETSP